jgi:hypothetical protein
MNRLKSSEFSCVGFVPLVIKSENEPYIKESPSSVVSTDLDCPLKNDFTPWN